MKEEDYLTWRQRTLDDAGFTRRLVEDPIRFKGTVKQYFEQSARLIDEKESKK